MTKIYLFLPVAVLAQVALSAPESDSVRPIPSTLDNVINQVKIAYDDVIVALNKQFPYTKSVSDAFAQQANKFTKDFEKLLDDVKYQMDQNQEQLKGVYANITKKLTEHIGDLKDLIGPKAASRVDDVTAQIQKNFQFVYDGIWGVVEAAKPGNIQGTAEKARGYTAKFFGGLLNILKVAETSVESTYREFRRGIARFF